MRAPGGENFDFGTPTKPLKYCTLLFPRVEPITCVKQIEMVQSQETQGSLIDCPTYRGSWMFGSYWDQRDVKKEPNHPACGWLWERRNLLWWQGVLWEGCSWTLNGIFIIIQIHSDSFSLIWAKLSLEYPAKGSLSWESPGMNCGSLARVAQKATKTHEGTHTMQNK